MSCLFCDLINSTKKEIFEDEFVYVIKDSFPVSKGHLLVITKRHIESFFDISSDEWTSIKNGLDFGKKYLEKLYKPQGYNIGCNQGKVAGQTIMHLHIHLIPRYEFDVEDPSGGIRAVIPGKQKY
jgi:diadenosine tetraphosphate (Ap4A) HIT family hydrolase